MVFKYDKDEDVLILEIFRNYKSYECVEISGLKVYFNVGGDVMGLELHQASNKFGISKEELKNKLEMIEE